MELLATFYPADEINKHDRWVVEVSFFTITLYNSSPGWSGHVSFTKNGPVMAIFTDRFCENAFNRCMFEIERYVTTTQQMLRSITRLTVTEDELEKARSHYVAKHKD